MKTLESPPPPDPSLYKVKSVVTLVLLWVLRTNKNNTMSLLHGCFDGLRRLIVILMKISEYSAAPPVPGGLHILHGGRQQI